ncbi:MAG: EamA family transporter [Candidatus Micrarchaeia archaeon]
MEFVIELALLIGLAWSIDGILIKKFVNVFGQIKAAFIITTLNFVVSLLMLPFFHSGSINTAGLILALCSGLLSGLGFILFFSSLKSEQASNTFTLMELQVVILIIFGILALSEELSSIVIFGIILILIGVLFVSYTKELKLNRKLIPAMLANILWGLGWILFYYSYTYDKSILYTMIASFGASIILPGIYLTYSISRQKNKASGTIKIKNTDKKIEESRENKNIIIMIGIIAGLLSGIGNFGFSILESINEIAIGSAISNLQPIFITIIAYFVYKERLTKLQTFGIVIAVSGAFIVFLI